MFEDQGGFSPKLGGPKLLAPVVDAKFERHVHPNKFANGTRSTAAQVVNRKFGAADEADDAIQAACRAVGIFRRKPGKKSKIGDAERYRLKERGEFLIERAIDKYRPVKWRRQDQPLGG
jgi:hypothetical protein